VWWLLHDGGILILVAYLLQRHATWRHCILRIFTVVQVGVELCNSRVGPGSCCLFLSFFPLNQPNACSSHRQHTPCNTHAQGGERDVLKTQLELTHYLQALRIRAEVHVVGLDLQDMGEYGEDWTVRRRRNEKVDQQRSALAGVFGEAQPAGTAEASYATGGATQQQPPPPPLQPAPAPAPGPAALGGAAHIDEGSKIQRAIVENSRDSALVLVNLPPPPKSAWVDPVPYFKLVEHLTGELPRVILVYGSGVECLTTYI
jgi:hypothetical protein